MSNNARPTLRLISFRVLIQFFWRAFPTFSYSGLTPPPSPPHQYITFTDKRLYSAFCWIESMSPTARPIWRKKNKIKIQQNVAFLMTHCWLILLKDIQIWFNIFLKRPISLIWLIFITITISKAIYDTQKREFIFRRMGLDLTLNP